MSFLYSVLGFFLAIGVLVAVHEFGHFWVARKLGVKVLRFSIGFGKPLWTKVGGKDQVEYVIAAIPLGGYVKMLGEGDDVGVSESDAHRAFDRQAIWKRALIVLAGPGINFLFAILLFMVLGLNTQQGVKPTFGTLNQQALIAQAGVSEGDTLLSVDGRNADYMMQYDLYIFNQVLKGEDIAIKVRAANASQEQYRTVVLNTSDVPIYNINPSSLMNQLGFVRMSPPANTQISQVVPGSAADRAGLLAGDKFVSINHIAVNSWYEMVAQIQPSAGVPLNVVVDRAGSRFELVVTPEAVDVNGEKVARMGIGRTPTPYTPEQIIEINRSPLEALAYGVERTWLMSTLTLRMLWKMVTLQVSHKNVNGPITIADVAGQAIQIGWETYVYVLAVISISLGVMNLLPIPMLDGGHLLMYSIELVAGKNIAEKAFAVGQRLGVLMLICLMSLAFYNDIFRLLN